MRVAIYGIGILAVFTTAAQATETVTYTYDARGRVVAVTHSGTVNNGIVTSYSTSNSAPTNTPYDKADNRTQVTTTGASH